MAMKRDEIREVFQSLARSQGFYGRLLEGMTDEAYELLEQQNFEDAVDLIMYVEG